MACSERYLRDFRTHAAVGIEDVENDARFHERIDAQKALHRLPANCPIRSIYRRLS